MKYSVALLAVVGALVAAGEAAAGCCPACGCPVAAPVVVEQVVVSVDPIYVVNRGPQYSGPGHYLSGLGPFVRDVPDPLPSPYYPYIGFLYTGYPYGLQNSGGYPRGSYSPFTGYPYADPPPYVYRMYRSNARARNRY